MSTASWTRAQSPTPASTSMQQAMRSISAPWAWQGKFARLRSLAPFFGVGGRPHVDRPPEDFLRRRMEHGPDALGAREFILVLLLLERASPRRRTAVHIPVAAYTPRASL